MFSVQIFISESSVNKDYTTANAQNFLPKPGTSVTNSVKKYYFSIFQILINKKAIDIGLLSKDDGLLSLDNMLLAKNDMLLAKDDGSLSKDDDLLSKDDDSLSKDDDLLSKDDGSKIQTII